MPQISASFKPEIIDRIAEYPLPIQLSFSQKVEMFAERGLNHEADLVSFGQYLLSEERTKLVKSHSKETWRDRIKEVHHADIENWKERKIK